MVSVPLTEKEVEWEDLLRYEIFVLFHNPLFLIAGKIAGENLEENPSVPIMSCSN